jgi:3-methyladenine DNA glycosylase AlkD
VAVDQELVAQVRKGLAEVGDPERAPAMQAYMKSEMPFHGVPAPVARKVFRAAIDAHPLPDRQSWQDTVAALWSEATHREERYAALALAGHRRYRVHQDADLLPFYADLVRTGAWWDVVDDIASHLVGPILLSHPAAATPVVRAWATDRDLWLRRTAVICQLGAKDRTDVALLTAAIDANIDDREFFLRKAIGWALRQYARTDPDWVRAFVAARDGRLSTLSRREALKHLGGD